MVFGDFNVHHKDWLTYSGGTHRPSELCYNLSISNDLTEILNFSTQIPDYDAHSPALLDLFISSNTSICSTMAFPPFWNSDHAVISVSIDFPINSKKDPLFYCVAYYCSCAAWDDLHDHLRVVPWGVSLNSVLLLLLVNFVSWFKLEWNETSLISMVFNGLCCCHSS